MELTKTTDISSFFKRENNQWIFTVEKLEVYVPKIYEEKDMLFVGETAISLGIFQIRINDMYYANFLLLNKIEIEYVSYNDKTEDDFKYVVFNLIKGSVFIKNSIIVKNGNILYDIFVLFISHGKIPPFISYNDIHQLFDNDNKHCGVSLKINHSVFEMVFAHIYRSKDDPYTFYRSTDMKKPPIVVSISQISHGPTSTTSKIVGGYLSEGIVSALVDEREKVKSPIENMLVS